MKKIFMLYICIFTIDSVADDVGLTWYNNGTTITGPSSCTVGGTFTPPTPPARTGYNFAGWKADLTCGLNSIDLDITCRNWGYRAVDGSSQQDSSVYGLTENGQWGISCSYGKVIGEARCSSSYGKDSGTIGNPSTNTGGYCWCRVTQYIPNNRAACYFSSSAWAFHSSKGSYSTCAKNCGTNCPGSTRQTNTYTTPSGPSWRGALYGAVAR